MTPDQIANAARLKMLLRAFDLQSDDKKADDLKKIAAGRLEDVEIEVDPLIDEDNAIAAALDAHQKTQDTGDDSHVNDIADRLKSLGYYK